MYQTAYNIDQPRKWTHPNQFLNFYSTKKFVENLINGKENNICENFLLCLQRMCSGVFSCHSQTNFSVLKL